MQDRALDGITVGRDNKSNAIILYNPLNYIYYHPPAFHMDESQLPITNFTNSLYFDGGIICILLQNNTDPIHKTIPPGTHTSIQQN